MVPAGNRLQMIQKQQGGQHDGQTCDAHGEPIHDRVTPADPCGLPLDAVKQLMTRDLKLES